MQKIKRRIFTNGIIYKYKNNRVTVVAGKNNNYLLEFKTLTDSIEPRSLHHVEGGKIVRTLLKISPEAALSLINGLSEILKKDGYYDQF